MKCFDDTIKDLLPAYQMQVLDHAEEDRIRKHLEKCEDCRTELSLLRMMSEEPMPDPGEAFWASMPGRVYREVEESRNAKKNTFDLSWLWDRFIHLRWTWAAAAVGVVLVISWFAFRSPQKALEPSLSQSNEFADEIMIATSPDTESDAIHLSELDRQDLDMVDNWAGREFTSIAQDVDPAVVLPPEAEISEEFADLNAGEMDRLSTMLSREEEEG